MTGSTIHVPRRFGRNRTCPFVWTNLFVASLLFPCTAATVFEAESLTVAGISPGAIQRVFDAGSGADPNLSAGQGLLFEGRAAGDFISFSLDVPQAGICNVKVGVKATNNRGIFALSVNGQAYGSGQDLYSATQAYAELDVATVAIPAAGRKTFTFTISGKNEASTSYWLGLDYIKLDFAGTDTTVHAVEDGYDLWLRYRPVVDTALLTAYRAQAAALVVQGGSATLTAATAELSAGLAGLLGRPCPAAGDVTLDGTIIAGTPAGSPLVAGLGLSSLLQGLGDEGYLIRGVTLNGRHCIVIAANSDIGVLYGSFGLLRLLQSGQRLEGLDIVQTPRNRLRLLNHWDNLGGSIERGYAGRSLWQWSQLPDSLDPRYTDYARANASLGINGAVLNNVNASPDILTAAYLDKVKALADVMRPYGIRVFLTAQFSAPKTIGGLPTADPLDAAVMAWWQAKAAEIYAKIPDFGGFLVKANSEGQPGPYDYGRHHAEGANCLARALAPFGGIVMWRAFVYGDVASANSDRAAAAYEMFRPLDGLFDTNVVVQVKNGPIDFQPREPVHPLFGAMPQTGLAMEFEITQENLGHANHLVYLAPMWKEVLDFDTHARGAGTTVARIIDGSAFNHRHSVIAGVANTGSSRNWCGHHFAQANWYAFGRLAWDPRLSAASIAEEWSRLTFGNSPRVVAATTEMLQGSHEAYVDYTMPLGLTHIMEGGDHYDPAPAAWQGYHRADSAGIGFDRSFSGSNAVSQYFSPNRELFNDPATCPEKYLLWFHHVPYDFRLASGRTIMEELYRRYDSYYPNVLAMISRWESLHDYVDARRFREVSDKLQVQLVHAKKWRDVCVDYFSTVSGQPYVPTGIVEGTAARGARLEAARVTLNQGRLHVAFSLPGSGSVHAGRIELFDVRGRLVACRDFPVSGGSGALTLPAADLSAGRYLCRLCVDGRTLGVQRLLALQ